MGQSPPPCRRRIDALNVSLNGTAQKDGGGAPTKGGSRRRYLVLGSAALLMLSGLALTFHSQLRLVGSFNIGGRTDEAQISRHRPRRPPWHTVVYYEAMKSRVPIYNISRAAEAVQSTTWKCGVETTRSATTPHTLVAFVHVYKTGTCVSLIVAPRLLPALLFGATSLLNLTCFRHQAGSTMRLFFRDVANACKKNWVLLSTCTGVRLSSLKEPNTAWTPCRVSEVVEGRRGRVEQNKYGGPTRKSFVGARGKKQTKMNNLFVASDVDIIGGHMRVGTADYAFETEPPQGRVRHVVFLREPLERFVSGSSIPSPQV